jgi:O-antigen/teichoic acid export membrane protein
MLTGLVVGKGALFLSLMLLSRYLDDTSFGTITFAISLSLILYFIIDMGVSLIANRKFSIDPSRIQEVFSTALGLRAILTLLGYSLLLGASLIFYSKTQALIVGIIGAGVVLESWGELVFAIFRSRERMELEARSRIAGAVTSLVLVLIVVRADLGVYAAAATYTVRAAVLLTSAFLALGRFRIRLTPGFSRTHITKLLRESWPLGAMGLLLVAFQRLDVVIMEACMGIRAVGAYNELFRVLETMVLVITPTLLPGALFPSLCRVFRDGWSGFSRRMGGIAQLITGLAVLVMIPVFAGGTRLLESLWGSDYLRGQDPGDFQLAFIILMAAIPILFWMNYLVAGVIAAGRQKITIVVTAVSLLLSVGGNLVLIPMIGLPGAAIMVAASNGVMALLYFVVLRKLGPLPLLGGIWKPAISALAGVLVIYMTRNIPSLPVRMLTPAAAYLAVWLPLGGLKPLKSIAMRKSI